MRLATRMTENLKMIKTPIYMEEKRVIRLQSTMDTKGIKNPIATASMTGMKNHIITKTPGTTQAIMMVSTSKTTIGEMMHTITTTSKGISLGKTDHIKNTQKGRITLTNNKMKSLRKSLQLDITKMHHIDQNRLTIQTNIMNLTSDFKTKFLTNSTSKVN